MLLKCMEIVSFALDLIAQLPWYRLLLSPFVEMHMGIVKFALDVFTKLPWQSLVLDPCPEMHRHSFVHD
jgi:hypothetical protein